MLLNDDAGTIEAKPPAPETAERREATALLPWLFPWVLAFAGILITLALMR
jgi:hypothetical protein